MLIVSIFFSLFDNLWEMGAGVFVICGMMCFLGFLKYGEIVFSLFGVAAI